MSRGGVPGGGAVVLDVAQLEALLTKTFGIGLDAGRGREKAALVRLRLSRALLGAAGTQAMAAEALAIEQGVAAEQIAAAGGLALRAAAFNGMPDPVLPAVRPLSLPVATPVTRRLVRSSWAGTNGPTGDQVVTSACWGARFIPSRPENRS